MSYTYTPTVNTKWYYQFEDNANDSSGNSNNWTATSVTYTNSIHSWFSKAGSFNGSSSNISLPALWLWTGARTVSFWAYCNSLSSAMCAFYSWTASTRARFAVLIWTSGEVYLWWENADIYTSWWVVLSSQRVHITIAYSWWEVNTTNVKIYVDWANRSASFWGSGSWGYNTTNSNYTIWRDPVANTKYFNWLIDEVIIEDIARTAQQVLDRYNQSKKKYAWEYLWAGSWVTKWLYHLNWDAVDESWNGNSWIPSNISWVDGKFWQCGSFNGSSSKIVIPASTVNVSDYLTLNMWLTLWTLSNSWIKWLLGGQGNYAGNAHCQYYGTWTSDQSVMFNVAWCSPDADSKPLWTISANEWFMLTAVVDITNKKITYYRNGVTIWDQTFTTLPAINVSTELNIGRVYNTNRVHNWLIDEVIIENRAWTALEIQKHYTYTKGRFWIM